MDNSIFSHFKGQLFVGFSGGADSTALLLLAARGAEKSRCELTAVHFNHHLRGAESDKEALEAEKFARRLGVKFLKIDLFISPGSNLESRARQARLEKWQELCAGCEDPVVLLGHHLDDRIENLFIRIGRGSNVSGLTGLHTYSEVAGVRFFRPLLICTRKEIEEFLIANGVTSWAVDSSNLSCDFSRNALRNKILPEFFDLFPGGRKAVASTLENLSYDAVCLDRMAKTLYEHDQERFTLSFWQGQERAMTVRMLRLLCGELFADDAPLSAGAVERFEEMVQNGRAGICELDEKRKLRFSGERIFPLEEAPIPVVWEWQKEPVIHWGKWEFSADFAAEMPDKIDLFTACFDGGAFPEKLEIGSPLEGETMIPFGRKGKEKVKDLRIKRKVPAYPAIPVVRDREGMVLWLPGIRHSGAFPVQPESSCVVISAKKSEEFF